jgi:uncharacterized protein YggE
MTRRLLGVVTALVLTGGVALTASPQAQTATDPPTVTTTGESAASVPADIAFIQVSAEGRAKKTVDAQKAAAEAMTGVLTALKGLSLPANAIRTTGYSVTPEYDHFNNVETFRDFYARNSIEVRIEDLTRLATVIDTAGSSGAATVSGLRFDLKDRSKVERELLRQAVQDATSRAEAVATGAGRVMGSILKIQEQRFSSPIGYQTFGLAGGGGRGGTPTPVEPGEIVVRAQVTLTASIR